MRAPSRTSATGLGLLGVFARRALCSHQVTTASVFGQVDGDAPTHVEPELVHDTHPVDVPVSLRVLEIGACAPKKRQRMIFDASRF